MAGASAEVEREIAIEKAKSEPKKGWGDAAKSSGDGLMSKLDEMIAGIPVYQFGDGGLVQTGTYGELANVDQA